MSAFFLLVVVVKLAIALPVAVLIERKYGAQIARVLRME